MKKERTPAQSGDQLGKSAAAQNTDGEIQRLMSAGKCKQAVELAKEQHKKLNTPESQRLLVQAYVARIEQFQNKGMAQEAQTLLTLVQQRFPSERHQLQEMEIRAAAAEGRIRDLLRPLASDQTSPEIRAAIENTLRRHVTDLQAVASCDALAAEHPLRLGAAALWRAFEAVTSGPVAEADTPLSEISHRSPLAAWKMLIRAISAFYRQDDSACRRALDFIPVDSAITHVAMAVRSMVDLNKPAGGIAGALYARVLADDQNLRTALEKIESSYSQYDLSRLRGGIRDATRACSASRPYLLERLRQHILAWVIFREAPFDEVRSALGPVTCNAYFWRLAARATELCGAPAEAALFWERFLRHAKHEGMFTQASAEAATVWLHIAAVLSPASLPELDRDRKHLGKGKTISSYYDNQLQDIASLRPESDREIADNVLAPGRPFMNAAALRPDAETFASWWIWAERVGLPVKQQEDIALNWHKGRPRDAQPLLILSSLAESRNALSLAIKRLGEAEAIDPLNQQVRQARVRLTLSIAWRHFADGKAHLVEKDLTDLQALPSMGDGDRAAVLESMRGAWHHLRGDQVAESASFQSVVARLGPLAAPVLFNSIKIMAKQARESDLPVTCTMPPAQPVDIAQALARIIRLGEDLRLRLWQPIAWGAVVAGAIRQLPCPVSNAELLLIGRGAIADSQMELAYLASSAGLARGESPALTARFLLLRARSLAKSWQQSRKTQCLRAALELARAAHDENLVSEIFAVVDQDPFTHRIVTGGRSGQSMPDDVLREALENERKAGEFPRDRPDIDSFLAKGAVPHVGGFFGGFDNADDDEGWDDDDDDEDGPFDLDSSAAFNPLPPQNMEKLNEVLDQSGKLSPQELYDDPMPLIEAMSKAIGGKKISQDDLRALADTLRGLMGPSGASPADDPFDAKSSKRNKRKR